MSCYKSRNLQKKQNLWCLWCSIYRASINNIQGQRKTRVSGTLGEPTQPLFLIFNMFSIVVMDQLILWILLERFLISGPNFTALLVRLVAAQVLVWRLTLHLFFSTRIRSSGAFSQSSFSTALSSRTSPSPTEQTLLSHNIMLAILRVPGYYFHLPACYFNIPTYQLFIVVLPCPQIPS